MALVKNRFVLVSTIIALLNQTSFAEELNFPVRIKDLVEVIGVRSNQLTGIGIVVGLPGTGDSKTSIATSKAAAQALSRLGIMTSADEIITKNLAIVALTADLPEFARIGDKIDIRISSIGDATSLEGGTLLLSTLRGVDDTVYATVQGAISQGSSLAGAQGGDPSLRANSLAPKTISISKSGLVEKEFASTFVNGESIELSLRKADFTTADRIAKALNEHFKKQIAEPKNAGFVIVHFPEGSKTNAVDFMAKVEQIRVTPDTIARVVINERTGTVISGHNVMVSPVAISHGGLEITVGGKTQKVSQIGPTTTVNQLVEALNALGAGPKDIVSILQTLESAGALQAKLEII